MAYETSLLSFQVWKKIIKKINFSFEVYIKSIKFAYKLNQVKI